MRIQVTPAAQAEKAALHAMLLPEGSRVRLDSPAGKTAQALQRRKEFKGEYRETLLVYGKQDGSERLLLIGLGKDGEVTAERLRRATALALRRAEALKVKSLGITLASSKVKPAEAGAALAESLMLTSYQTPAERKESKPDPFKSLVVRIGSDNQKAAMAGGVERGRAVGEATNLARGLGDMPGNVLTPTVMARRAQQMSRKHGLKSRVYREKDLERMGMGGILAVSRGSVEPAALIEMTYQPKRFKKTVCLVGKGLTFDTGGISLKPSAKMDEMKYDMCGGAAVIGAMCALAQVQPNVRVIGLVPTSDNMPGGAAQKPGDVLKTASGLTVEVMNTDAEGRLILSDGLHHATGFDPDYIIDLATLTGACVIALGHDAAGLFSNDDRLSQMLKAAGEATGDRAWPMPLYPEYQDELKSSVADMKNLGGRDAGAGTAASFLSRFVGDHKWAHIDIAGTAWGGRNRDYMHQGATGAGVRLLVQFIESLG